MIIDLVISSLFYIPRVPKVPSMFDNRSTTPEISPVKGFSSSYEESYQYVINPCRERILRVISYSEGTYFRSLNTNGVFDRIEYDLMFGGKRFFSFSDHPRQLVSKWGYTSDAAGAYQFLSTTWDSLADELNLPDFSPESQDQAAIHLINKAGVLDEVDKCIFNRRITDALAKTWAGLPYVNDTSYYHPQPSKSFSELLEFWDSLSK